MQTNTPPRTSSRRCIAATSGSDAAAGRPWSPNRQAGAIAAINEDLSPALDFNLFDRQGAPMADK